MRSLLACLVLASCGGSSPPPASPAPPAPVSNTAPAPAPAAPSASVVLAKLIEFKDELCACKDTPCTQHVSDAMTKWAEDQAGKPDNGPKPTDEETKQMAAIGERMAACMTAAMATSPTPAP